MLHEKDRAFEQDVVVEVEILLLDLFRVLEAAGSGVVHQDIQALELPLDVLAQVANLIPLADVAELRDEPVSELSLVSCRFFSFMSAPTTVAPSSTNCLAIS